MNLLDLYEMRDPRDAYERDVANSQAGMGKQSRADVTGEEEPSGVFTVVINGRPWKTGSSNEMFALAGRIANKHTDKKVAVKWPTGELNTVRPQGVSEAQQLSVQQLATVSDEALDKAYGYGRSQPGNSFGWQANLKSAAFAKQMIDKGITDIEAISDAIHKGWNTTAQAFVQNPEQFDDTAKLKAAGKLEAKLQQRAQLMKQNYGQLPEEEKEKDRVVARALLQALKGEQGEAAGSLTEDLQADDGEYYSNSDKFFGQFEADHFDNEETSPDGMEIRGYIDGVNVMAWRFKSAKKVGGWGIYDDSALSQQGVTEAVPPTQQKPLMAVALDKWKQAVLNRYPEARFATQKMINGATIATDRSGQVGIYDPKTSYAKVGPETHQGVTEAEVDSDGHSVDRADSGEYDYEGDQARDQMNTIVRAARRLDGLLDDNENMPEWVQMKVTLAADYLDTAADYIESNQDPKLDDIFEADEWEENTEKWDRFKKWAIDQMMRSTEKVGTGNHVSKLENQYFDHPINVGPSNTSQQPFGTVTTNIGANKKWTEFVQSIIDNYENYEAEWKADSAASLIDNPEYKKFLDRAYTDFMGMGKNTTEQREQHAMALSGYQVKHFGGKLFGSLFGNIRGARASMTPEVYGALEKAEYDLEQKKIIDYDKKRNEEQLKFWQMLPYPIKLMVAAGMGKTPAQVEAILSTSGKSDNEIMGAYIDASNVPDYTPGQQQQQRPPMNEPPRLESDRGRGRPPAGEQDTTPITPGRVEKTATGIRHHADASRYGGTEPDAEDDHLMSKSHISRLGKMTEPDLDEGDKIGNMDADKFDAAMARLKQLAGAGPLKTVYDPTKRVYRNVPVAVQPKK
jgi:hypothetical protein